MNDEILKIIDTIHEFFKKKRIKLAVAESCTGGLISHYITCLPGASNFFEAGIVSYSAEAKKKILGVSSDIIKKYGLVSKETAKEMAEKTRMLTNSDFALSTTGNLGPDVLEDKEKGLIYIAVSKKGKTFIKELRLIGNREENKEKASFMALMFLLEIVKKWLNEK